MSKCEHCSRSGHHSVPLSLNSSVWLFGQDTFGRAKTWVSELQKQASPNIVIALAGNKADLSANRTVEYEVTCSLMKDECLFLQKNIIFVFHTKCGSLRNMFGSGSDICGVGNTPVAVASMTCVLVTVKTSTSLYILNTHFCISE